MSRARGGRSKSPTEKTEPVPAKVPAPKLALTKAESAALVQATRWEDREIKALHTIYAKVAQGATTSLEALSQNLAETSCIPLFQRILQLQNEDRSGMISFGEFAKAMSALSPLATVEEKIQFAWTLFDANGSGTLDSTEMFNLLRMVYARTRPKHRRTRSHLADSSQ